MPLVSLVAGALVIGSASAAHAIDLMGGEFEFVLQKPDPDSEGDFVDMSSEEREEFFNLANCVCDTEFAYRITLKGIPQVELPNEEVEIWVGSNCADIDSEPRRDCGTSDLGEDCRCELVQVIPDINDFKTEQTIRISTLDFMFPGQPLCELGTARRNLYLITDEDGDGRPDDPFDAPAEDKFIDTEPPPLPLNPVVSAGEAGALIEWDLPGSDEADIRSFQVMCGRVDGEPIDLGEKRAFDDPDQICPELFEARQWPVVPALPGPPSTSLHGPLIDAGAADAGVADAGVADAGVDAGGPDAGPDGPEIIDLTGLVPCTGELAPTAQSVRVSGLENGVEYRMVLLVIDPALNRNPFGIELPLVTPVPVTDFWEDYKGRGGVADGGFCFVATAAYGDYDHPYVRVLRDFRDETLAGNAVGRWFIRTYYDYSPPLAGFIDRHPVAAWVARVVLAPVVAFAGLWVYSGALGKLGLFAIVALLVAWRRVRKARRAALPPSEDADPPRRSRVRRTVAAAAAGAAILVALGASATAQPYWDEPGGPADQASAERHANLHSDWAFDLKFGPYKPDVDSEFDITLADGDPACLSEGPYNCMFGGGELMTMMELDRFFLYPSGQLGIGVGLGWFKTSANAYQIDADGNPEVEDGELVRAGGDKTTFRILPVWVNAVYRFTNLDDELGIPLVPYGKLGLSYYIWSIARPDGDISSVPDDPMCTDEDCSQNKARGASLGWQGTLGIAFRADRLDKKMAQSLNSELGIEHSGFFVEMTMAKVDGFGADDKLTLGDTTWFAGINFEF